MRLAGLNRDLERLCPGGVLRDVRLSEISRWRIGGFAEVIVRPHSVPSLQAVRRYLFDNGLPHVVIGATSNLLFSDAGLRVVCLQIGEPLSRTSIRGEEVEAEAGAWAPGLACRVMKAGLTGAEHICGIPGTLGGLICMNGGSQRKGIGSSIIELRAVSASGDLVSFNQEDCGFAYRTSVFQNRDLVVASALLRFERAFDKSAVRRQMIGILRDRRRKFPRKEPNCGSVFKSSPAMHAAIGAPGAVIERLGLKGHRRGGARISAQHANFVVNEGGARAGDVLDIISDVEKAVVKATGFCLEAEALFVSTTGQILPANKALALP